MVNKDFLDALAKDFREGGAEAIAKVREQHPAAYMKILALLVPREHRIEHTNPVSRLSDEQLEAAIATLEEIIERQASEATKVIEGKAE